jgi:RNA polymerase sigma factor (sigma-70 family)
MGRAMTIKPACDERTDGQLLQSLREGEKEAYGVLFRRHHPLALRVAQRITTNPDAAADAAAEAFAAIYAAIRAGSGPAGVFVPYLRAVVTREVRKHASRTARERLTDRDSLLGRPVEDPIRVEGESGRVAARAAFELLPQRWQEVLWFLDVQEMHPRDIAPVMGLSPNAVAALHRRAVTGLKLAFIRHHSGMNTPASCHKFLVDLPAHHARTLKRGRHDDIRHHLVLCQACSRIDATFETTQPSGWAPSTRIPPWILSGVREE